MSKNITSGQGGAITTSNAHLYNQASLYHDFWRSAPDRGWASGPKVGRYCPASAAAFSLRARLDEERLGRDLALASSSSAALAAASSQR